MAEDWGLSNGLRKPRFDGGSTSLDRDIGTGVNLGRLKVDTMSWKSIAMGMEGHDEIEDYVHLKGYNDLDSCPIWEACKTEGLSNAHDAARAVEE